MKLLIIRHGDPDYSIDSLTETGWREAELLADRLEKQPIAAFYASPLGRAQDTAHPLLKRLGATARVMPWLREFAPEMTKTGEDGSVRTGCVWDWLPAEWTAEPRYYDRENWCKTEVMQAAGAEQEAAWVAAGLDELLASHGYERCGGYYKAVRPNNDTVALFCHFGVECVLLAHLLGVSPMVLWHGSCAVPSSVTTLITEERRAGAAYFRMNAFGDTAHLYAAGQEPSFAARFCETYAQADQRHD